MQASLRKQPAQAKRRWAHADLDSLESSSEEEEDVKISSSDDEFGHGRAKRNIKLVRKHAPALQGFLGNKIL